MSHHSHMRLRPNTSASHPNRSCPIKFPAGVANLRPAVSQLLSIAKRDGVRSMRKREGVERTQIRVFAYWGATIDKSQHCRSDIDGEYVITRRNMVSERSIVGKCKWAYASAKKPTPATRQIFMWNLLLRMNQGRQIHEKQKPGTKKNLRESGLVNVR